ncbi:MAG: APC family permease [Anaerolineaceae bacterium]|nr:APC family permease [Anaerolineaceae bacterium]
MFSKIKYAFVGSPLPTASMFEKRLNKVRALAAFSPDALSSIAYANQEIYLGLMIAGTAGLSLSFPIAVVIIILLIVVALSYSQTIKGYPSGGGSYVVARENLGTMPGLVAAAALLIDYVLNAAVSLTAGVAAISSAFPFLLPYRIYLALGILLILVLLNLRGLQETGSVMSIPVYLFLFTYIPMLIYGLIQLAIHGVVPLASAAPIAVQPLGILLILHAFSAGCTALTGIETISNGVPAFKPPEVKNAQKTLLIMAFLMGFLFLGSIGLTQFLAVTAGANETILSALARRLFGNSFFYYLIQISTLSILAVAANSSFAGFPRVAAILAKDGFMPRQLDQLGDRLVFNNGIVMLSIATAVLIVLFQGDSHLLVPLFAVGAFLAFTLSQTGMVVHWIKSKEKNRWLKAALNSLGALVTASALVVITISKFREGAWVSVLLLPLLISLFLRIRNHYKQVSAQLSMHGLPPSILPVPPTRVVMPISGIHRGMVDAINFARSISKHVTAIYVELEPGSGEKIREDWMGWWPDVELAVVPSPYRSIVEPILKYMDEDDQKHNDGQQAVVVLPEFIPAKPWQGALHNQTAAALKNALLFQRRRGGYQRVIIDVPYHLKK